jgi:predicted PurR-regulated permease PerM
LQALALLHTRAMNERWALGWLAVCAVLAIVWLALPFATGLLLGTLLAFTLEPIYALLVRRSGRPLLAALVTVIASILLILGALSAFVTQFVTRAVQFADAARTQLHSGGPLGVWVDAATGWLDRFGISAASVTSQLEAGAGAIASRSAALAAAFASGAFAAILGLFFAMLSMYLVLRYWSHMVASVVLISPLDPDYTRALLAEFRRVGRMTVSGTVLTGLSQGFLATIGFWITGVPQPIFFGIATALASLIPAVGTMLIWVPAGLYLLASGHPGSAVVELAWGVLLVIGACDYVIRPRLVGDSGMPTLLVFIALFGALEVLGLSGLIIGPVIMSLALAVLRMYSAEEARRRTAARQTAAGEHHRAVVPNKMS